MFPDPEAQNSSNFKEHEGKLQQLIDNIQYRFVDFAK